MTKIQMATISLPVETKVRELNGKVWLALSLANRGHEVILGEQNAINEGIDLIEPDIHFGDSAVNKPSRIELFRTLREAGAVVVVLDTEGGFFTTADAFSERLSAKVLPYVDRYFAWGECPASILANRRNFPREKAPVTGNPRFDILGPEFDSLYEPEAEKIRIEYNDFLLVNTNFSIANHYDDELLGDGYAKHRKYEEKLLEAFLEILKRLNTDLGLDIVIRPHPSESHETYRQYYSNVEGISVRHEGSVRPWIQAAKGVLHNSCTTGVESALMKTPTFSYRPVKNPQFDIEVPNIVSHEHQSYESLRDDISSYLRDGRPYEIESSQRDGIRPYLANLDHGAAERIADEIDELVGRTDSNVTITSFNPEKRVKRSLVKLLGPDRTEYLIESVTSRDYRYKNQKFPGLETNELEERIGRFNEHVNPKAYEVTEIRGLPFVFRIWNRNEYRDS